LILFTGFGFWTENVRLAWENIPSPLTEAPPSRDKKSRAASRFPEHREFAWREYCPSPQARHVVKTNDAEKSSVNGPIFRAPKS
jgi:hypothetical protein